MNTRTPGPDAWISAAAAPALVEGEVHVWRARVDTTAERRDRLAATLSAEERRRAERFRFDIDRHRYIVRHGLLRKLLGAYLGKSPQGIAIGFEDHGKPVLAAGVDTISFNASHSHGLALFAFARGTDIGVDVERIDSRRADAGVARQFFAPGEVAALDALAGERWIRGFFDCWTRKEAFVKAIGEGLSYPLGAFEVALAPDVPARLLSVQASTELARQWSLIALDPASDYAAALVVRGVICALLLQDADPF